MVSGDEAGRWPGWHQGGRRHIQGTKRTSAACLAWLALPRHCLTSPQGCFLCCSGEELQSWQPQMTLPRNISLPKLSSLRRQEGGRNPGAVHRKQTKPHFCDSVTKRKVKVTIRASQTSPDAADSVRWGSHHSGAPVEARWPGWVELGPGGSGDSRASLGEKAGKMEQVLFFQRFHS